MAFDDGDLGLGRWLTARHGNAYSATDRERWHAMLIRIASERDYKPGWAAHKYQRKIRQLPGMGRGTAAD